MSQVHILKALYVLESCVGSIFPTGQEVSPEIVYLLFVLTHKTGSSTLRTLGSPFSEKGDH